MEYGVLFGLAVNTLLASCWEWRALREACDGVDGGCAFACMVFHGGIAAAYVVMGTVRLVLEMA